MSASVIKNVLKTTSLTAVKAGMQGALFAKAQPSQFPPAPDSAGGVSVKETGGFTPVVRHEM
ncbi:hypothetical protein [Pantoea anthophila]|uniref:hypothetical protein n=1 Tax=Pantoea anthophila TaxID=470931 RepID=UPI002780CAB9|nr:hypothetical protein [Pantoea anthophila]MDQ1210897.1 hypothetical protein [Pantoea anthophila]